MTADKVVDASALAALTFNEPDGPAVEVRLSGAALYAPRLIEVEMASVCLKKIRNAGYPRDVVMRLYLAYPNVGIRKMDVEFVEAIELAERLQLSLYDASYLWLARHLGAELVTLDEKLAKAAKAS